jgi:CRISPR-associated protein (TIGR03984 family)
MADETKLTTLSDAIGAFTKLLGEDEKAFAILYTPKDCHLLLVDKDGKFFKQTGEFTPETVFEARIFNDKAELRWLHESDGKGKMAIISDAGFPDAVGTIPQTYLLWGERVKLKEGEQNPMGWTKFGSARIGSFDVPVTLKDEETYARFTAVEYLKTYEDGNVAVVDERLTGIEGYKGE